MKFKVIRLALVSLSLFLPLTAQIHSPEVQSYLHSRSKCDESLKAETWEAAETLCKDALDRGVKLSRPDRDTMEDYENYAFSLFSQSKFKLALANYTQALQIGTSFLKADSSDLAYAYFNVGRANQGMASIDGRYIVPAETNYLQAEKIYRAALKIAPDPPHKTEIKNSIRRTLVLLRMIAAIRGETEKLKAIEARMSALDAQT